MQSKYSNMNGCCAFFNGRSGLECQWELPAMSRRSPIAQSSQLDGRMTLKTAVEDEYARSLSVLGVRFKSHEHMRRHSLC